MSKINTRKQTHAHTYTNTHKRHGPKDNPSLAKIRDNIGKQHTSRRLRVQTDLGALRFLSLFSKVRSFRQNSAKLQHNLPLDPTPSLFLLFYSGTGQQNVLEIEIPRNVHDGHDVLRSETRGANDF